MDYGLYVDSQEHSLTTYFYMMVEFHLCWLLIRSRELNLFLESMLYISNGSRTGDSLIHEHAFSEPHLTEKKGHAGPDVYTHRAGCSLAIPGLISCAGATRML